MNISLKQWSRILVLEWKHSQKIQLTVRCDNVDEKKIFENKEEKIKISIVQNLLNSDW